MHAASLGVAGVASAAIAIITKGFCVDGGAFAATGAARVIGGTGVAVAARHGIGCVDATKLRITRIVGACVAVVTSHGRAAAHAELATVRLRAGIAVAARIGVVGEHALAAGSVTTICCARVIVITDRRRAGYAHCRLAAVANGARVAVAARRSIVDVHATRLHVAGIVRASVAVVAAQLAAGLAGTTGAGVAHGADAAIGIARLAIALGHHAALASGRGAEVLCAEIICTSVAIDHGLGIDDALVRHVALVAK